MKELEIQNKLIEKETIEVQQLDKKKQEFKFEHSIKTLKGHNVWEIELKSEDVRKAEFKPIDVVEYEDVINGNISNDLHKEVIRKPGCIYISALNATNALKRYKNNKGSALKPEGIFDITNPYNLEL